MEDDGEFSGDRDDGAPMTAFLSQLHSPDLQGGVLGTTSHDGVRGVIEGRANVRIAGSGDMS